MAVADIKHVSLGAYPRFQATAAAQLAARACATSTRPSRIHTDMPERIRDTLRQLLTHPAVYRHYDDKIVAGRLRPIDQDLQNNSDSSRYQQ